LKAPLMSVLGLINIARMEDVKNGNTFSNYFDMMEQSINKLDDTLKEILEYSRNARQELSIEEVDVSKIIADNLERMQYIPGSELLRKDVNINASAPLHADAYRISVIFNNLISNAIKYSDPHKDDPFLKIDIDINEEKAIFLVEDNGIGIAKEYISKVFDMFFRATAQKEGAGLGLYIVKETVEKLHGMINIESEPRMGTSFKIEIPNFKNFAPVIEE
jgi:signal transduction histidine kinase